MDTNSYLLNGAPNPYAGSDFIYDYQGDGFLHPEINANWRAMLTYGIDLRDKVPSWLQFLGHHRFMAEASTHDDVQQIDPPAHGHRRRRRLLHLGAVPAEQPAGDPRQLELRGAGPTDPIRWEYVSAPGSHAATFAPALTGIPGYGSPTNFTATTYNYYTGQWVNSGLTLSSPAFNGYQITENVQDQKTYYWQSFFWNDRIVGSLGINDDVVKNRAAATIYNAVINGVPTATSNNAGLVSVHQRRSEPRRSSTIWARGIPPVAGVYPPGTSQLAQPAWARSAATPTARAL